MTKILYAQRSMYQNYQRCRRLRWLENYEGKQGIGLVPKRKSLHLVVGSAVHSGMEILLKEGQSFLDSLAKTLTVEGPNHPGPRPATLSEQLMFMFANGNGSVARAIEDKAVEAALEDLRREFGSGVELDPEESAAMQQQQQAKQPDGITTSPQIDMGGLQPGQSSNTVEQDSPIVISFDGLDGLIAPANTPTEELSKPTWKGETSEQYLLAELSALTEGMVRAWSRRRWRGVLEQFEVLEVEREGEWKLGEYRPLQMDIFTTDANEPFHTIVGDDPFEIHFLSRHDALLFERSTNYLYLQSFKTTGSWDRRKEMDAQVDMQGLSEAVDVERRFCEAWELLMDQKNEPVSDATHSDATQWRADRISELVSGRTAEWLATLHDPPQILGVRYEYLLKGSRKKDKKDAMNPDRYVQESILCRAYKQEGITSDDRRWAWTYDWQDESGKGRRLDYRSWSKSPVWKFMPIADWIDLLDQGKVQEGALNEQGEALDALAEQFVPVLTVYRNSDEMLDLLEQMESQEVQIAKDVEEVRRAEREEGYAGKRTALNRLFPQTRTACSYPGVCQYRTTSSQAGFCFGAADPFHDPVVLERFSARIPNHPQEISKNGGPSTKAEG